jgi:hypothetical protein
MTTAAHRPAAGEYAAYYERYITRVPETDIVEQMHDQQRTVAALAHGIAPDRERHAYDAGKWTVREVLGHLADAERVFAYRALRISRGDMTPLAGFDENAYVPQSRAGDRPVRDLIADFTAVREATIRLFASLDDTAWRRIGTANGHPLGVRALAFIIVGHVDHHLAILRERCGLAIP